MTGLPVNAEQIVAAPTAEAPSTGRESAGRVRGLLQVAGLAGLFAALIVSWAFWQTGSFSLVWPYLQGQRLLFDPSLVFIEDVSAGTIIERSVRIANRTSADVRLLGARPSCGCITTDKFPITIPAGQDQTLTIKLDVPPTAPAGPFEHEVTLFVDHDGTRSIVVSVAGRVE